MGGGVRQGVGHRRFSSVYVCVLESLEIVCVHHVVVVSHQGCMRTLYSCAG